MGEGERKRKRNKAERKKIVTVTKKEIDQINLRGKDMEIRKWRPQRRDDYEKRI